MLYLFSKKFIADQPTTTAVCTTCDISCQGSANDFALKERTLD